MLGVAPDERVLDMGCGSGAVTRTLARRVLPGGHVVGMDTSASMLRIARELADKAGLGGGIEFMAFRKLPFPDVSFDCVLAATTLSHVPDPESALSEMVRVTRPGGRVGVSDVDGDLTLFTHPDRDLTRRIVCAFSDLGWVNGLFARRLPSLLASMGVVNVAVKGFVPLESEGYYANRAERPAEEVAAEGAITSEEKAGGETLRVEIAAKRFLGGQVHLFVWGTRAP